MFEKERRRKFIFLRSNRFQPSLNLTTWDMRTKFNRLARMAGRPHTGRHNAYAMKSVMKIIKCSPNHFNIQAALCAVKEGYSSRVTEREANSLTWTLTQTLGHESKHGKQKNKKIQFWDWDSERQRESKGFTQGEKQRKRKQGSVLSP